MDLQGVQIYLALFLMCVLLVMWLNEHVFKKLKLLRIRVKIPMLQTLKEKLNLPLSSKEKYFLEKVARLGDAVHYDPLTRAIIIPRAKEPDRPIVDVLSGQQAIYYTQLRMVEKVDRERQNLTATPLITPSQPQNSNVSSTTFTMPAWWKAACHEAVHIMIVGETGSGKTTIARALLKERSQTGKVIVFDSNDVPNRWGMLAVGGGWKFLEIDKAMAFFLGEIERRYTERAKGIFDHETVTIVVEESNIAREKIVSFKEFLINFSCAGREAGFKLIYLAQSNRVKSLGLEGQGDIRSNFSFIRLGDKAKESGIELSGSGYQAAWEHKGKNQLVDTSFMISYDSYSINESNIYKLDLALAKSSSSSYQPSHLSSKLDLGLARPKSSFEQEQLNLIKLPHELTANHILAWKLELAGDSIRSIARKIYPGTDGGGWYSEQVNKLLEEFRECLAIELEQVQGQ